MYKKILVPIDGSETSMLGLSEAIRVAKGDGSQLCLVHVVNELRQSGGDAGTFIDRYVRRNRTK